MIDILRNQNLERCRVQKVLLLSCLFILLSSLIIISGAAASDEPVIYSVTVTPSDGVAYEEVFRFIVETNEYVDKVSITVGDELIGSIDRFNGNNIRTFTLSNIALKNPGKRIVAASAYGQNGEIVTELASVIVYTAPPSSNQQITSTREKEVVDLRTDNYQIIVEPTQTTSKPDEREVVDLRTDNYPVIVEPTQTTPKPGERDVVDLRPTNTPIIAEPTQTTPTPTKTPQIQDTQVKTTPTPTKTPQTQETQVKTTPTPTKTPQKTVTQKTATPVPSGAINIPLGYITPKAKINKIDVSIDNGFFGIGHFGNYKVIIKTNKDTKKVIFSIPEKEIYDIVLDNYEDKSILWIFDQHREFTWEPSLISQKYLYKGKTYTVTSSAYDNNGVIPGTKVSIRVKGIHQDAVGSLL